MNREYYQKNKERLRKYYKEYYEKNREYLKNYHNQYNKWYYKKHPYKRKGDKNQLGDIFTLIIYNTKDIKKLEKILKNNKRKI